MLVSADRDPSTERAGEQDSAITWRVDPNEKSKGSNLGTVDLAGIVWRAQSAQFWREVDCRTARLDQQCLCPTILARAKILARDGSLLPGLLDHVVDPLVWRDALLGTFSLCLYGGEHPD